MGCGEEYRCLQCGHAFTPAVDADRETVCCPRCGSNKLERVPYLFGSPDAEGLTPEDYYAVCLKS